MKKNSGFSLLEVMIVIAILADVVLIALPSFIRAREVSQNSAFINDLRTATNAFEMYAAEHSRYPTNTPQGVVPPGMQVYLGDMQWTDFTPISGRWNWDNNRNGVTAAVCVVFASDADDVRMNDIDDRVDNGVLSTGAFRKFDSRRFGHVIEP